MDVELLVGVSPSLRARLLKAGFRSMAEVAASSAVELAREVNCTPAEALAAIQAAGGGGGIAAPADSTAAARLQMEQSQRGITTMCLQLDAMIERGVPLGKLTEFCGVPGIGKTQLAMQLCVSACLPVSLGGAGGSAVYIDTEGSFVADRLAEMARGTARACLARLGVSSLPRTVDLVSDAILWGIQVQRVHSAVEQIAAVHAVEDQIESLARRPVLARHDDPLLVPKESVSDWRPPTGPVKLIVIDSLAFHLRYDLADPARRARILASISSTLARLATRYGLAVALINQLTTAFGAGGNRPGDETTAMVPALGESWGHACANRILLFWDGSQRWAQMFKSAQRAESVVPYAITVGGIRDSEEVDDEATPGNTRRAPTDPTFQTTKRIRLVSEDAER